MLALARQQNVLVSGKSGIGKTFAAAFLIRETLLNDAEGKALVLVSGAAKTTEVFNLLTRLCSAKVVVASESSEHLWRDASYSKRECAHAKVLCVSPAIASNLFHLGHLSYANVALIVVEDTEEMFTTAATFTATLASKYTKQPRHTRPKLFAMVSKTLSELDLPTSSNPLYPLVSAFCITQPTFRKRATIAPIIVETFQYEATNYTGTVGHPVEFLRGANALHCNAEALFASLLALGSNGSTNSQYDVMIESRCKQFADAAETVLEQLGLWCFLKYIELELRHELDEALLSQNDRRLDAHSINLLTTSDEAPSVISAASDMSDHADVKSTRSFLDWIVTQQQTEHGGLQATHSRLKKAADLVGAYMENAASHGGRCWIFMQRRAHTRVVAEYMTACFPSYPPCCSLQGGSQASIAGQAAATNGALKAVDVEALFNDGRNPVLVSTALSTEVDQIALCGLVISMDEVVDPHKLLDFRQRAHPDHGVFKYIIADTPLDFEKYRALFTKMATLLSLDNGHGGNDQETLDQAVMPRLKQRYGSHHHGGHGGRTKYELYHADVKAKMTLDNSIALLTAFCHTLPGIKIYDNRPLYVIKRHLVGRHHDSRKRFRSTSNNYDDDADNHRKFLYSASLKLPSMLRVKHVLLTPKVVSAKQAKCMAAYKAVELLLKRGFLDRSFKSKLLINRNFIPQESVDEDMELETQNSYDIPAATAVEMGLAPIKSKFAQDTDQAVMYLYGLGGMPYGILVHMSTHPKQVTLPRAELVLALQFHVMLMRLICYGVDAAANHRDDDVEAAFSSKNDKGYIVVPVLLGGDEERVDIDWAELHNLMQTALLRPAWPLPTTPHGLAIDEWIFVSNRRRDVAYVVQGITPVLVGDVARRVVANNQYWSYTIQRAKSAPGVPILGRWYTKDALLKSTPEQPLVHGIEIPAAVPLIRYVHEQGTSPLEYGHLKERLLIPDQTSILSLRKSQYFEALRLLPLLFEFERKCQLSTLMFAVGRDIHVKYLEQATTKPAYERLEMLGDCFLKLESTWWLYQNRPDIKSEGTLSMLRGDMIRNDRLCKLSMDKMLHHYMIYPADFEQRPFRTWIPSCMGRTPDAVIAHLKWIADVLESTCGAYIEGAGEVAGRAWTGCSVCETPQVYNRTYFPHCLPQPVPAQVDPETPRDLATWDLTHLGYDDIPERMYLLQTSLKYNFKDKRLLL
ncbi:hypothetical protein DYB38_006292, partial [Aphanomyces astaci]